MPAMELLPAQDFQPYPRPNNFHTMSLGLLIFLPVVNFVIVFSSFTFAYHDSAALVWLVVALSYGIALLFGAAAARQARGGPKYWLNMGLLCALGTTIALIVGLVNWQRHFRVYWAYEGQREYTNVSPSDSALKHLDAGRILFERQATLDAVRAAEYRHGHNSFCVAPVVLPKQSSASDEVQYWAAGVNCCEQGASFSCGDAGNPQAHAGLVYLDDVPNAEHVQHFMEAVKGTVQRKNSHSSADALFIEWVVDPAQAQRSYWSYGIRVYVATVCIYSGVSVVLGFVLHFRPTPAKTKLEARRF